MADTMFSHKRRALIADLDSLCIHNREEMIATLRDSLVQYEVENIKKITRRD